MSEDNNIKQNFRVAWGRLIRIPNLFTVPGDPIAGALLAAGLSGADIVWKSVFAASLCSLFFYTAGLIDNDLADLDEDMRERPDRPLCSGVISILSARIVSVLLFLAGGCLFFFSGAGVAALSTALLLLCFILLYNRLKKRFPRFASLIMGGCRGLSLLMGAAVVSDSFVLPGMVWIAFGGWCAYIAAVTFLAADETKEGVGSIVRFLPGVAALSIAVAVLLTEGTGHLTHPVLLAGLVVGGYALMRGSELHAGSSPAQIQRTIGSLIHALIWMQALVSLSNQNGRVASISLMGVYMIAKILAGRFYAS